MSIDQSLPIDGHAYLIRNVQLPMVCLTLHDKPNNNTPGKLPFLHLTIYILADIYSCSKFSVLASNCSTIATPDSVSFALNQNDSNSPSHGDKV